MLTWPRQQQHELIPIGEENEKMQKTSVGHTNTQPEFVLPTNYN